MVSNLEVIYDRLVADEKLKKGTKYERLAAIIFKALDASSNVVHDVRLVGDGKKTRHQIDVHIERESDSSPSRVLVECRDYESDLISLKQVRDFNGALIQLQPSTGIMVTTVGFTRGARDYAIDEGIMLVHLRSFEERDWQNRLAQIDLVVTCVGPGGPRISWIPVDPAAAEMLEREMPDETQIGANTSLYYDHAGVPLGTLSELLGTWWTSLRVPLSGGTLCGREIFDSSVSVAYGSGSLEVVGFDWEVATIESSKTISIGPGERIAELIIRSLDGSLDEVIFDSDLLAWSIDDRGHVAPRE